MNPISSISNSIKESSFVAFSKVAEDKKMDFLENIKNAFQKEFESIYLLEKEFSTKVTEMVLNSAKKEPPAISNTESAAKNSTPSKMDEVKLNSKTEINIFSKYDGIVKEMSDKYNVSFDLIKKVIHTESTFNPNAVSRSGALGLMQLMPKTAEWLGVKNPLNPRENIEGGVKYLSKMIDKYEGNVKLALAAYNAGPGNVDKFGGIPPFKETQNYVKKILG